MCFGGNAFIGEHETLGKSERVDREYLDEQIDHIGLALSSPTQGSPAGLVQLYSSLQNQQRPPLRPHHSLACPCAQSAYFALLSADVGLKDTLSQTSCTEIPNPQSTSQVLSCGNNMMTILPMRKLNLRKNHLPKLRKPSTGENKSQTPNVLASSSPLLFTLQILHLC